MSHPQIASLKERAKNERIFEQTEEIVKHLGHSSFLRMLWNYGWEKRIYKDEHLTIHQNFNSRGFLLDVWWDGVHVFDAYLNWGKDEIYGFRPDVVDWIDHLDSLYAGKIVPLHSAAYQRNKARDHVRLERKWGLQVDSSSNL